MPGVLSRKSVGAVQEAMETVAVGVRGPRRGTRLTASAARTSGGRQRRAQDRGEPGTCGDGARASDQRGEGAGPARVLFAQRGKGVPQRVVAIVTALAHGSSSRRRRRALARW